MFTLTRHRVILVDGIALLLITVFTYASFKWRRMFIITEIPF